MTATWAAPVVATAGGSDPAAPLVVLLHGRGSHEQEIIALAEHLPAGPAYTAVRAPIAEGGGTPGSPTGGSADRSPSRCARRWTGSGSGSTRSPRPVARWS